MKLSACMIVKDEEEVIERCLDSIIDHVNELIIVDTGSSDRTVDIICDRFMGFQVGFKTKLETYPWNGNFADMRNKSMELATGDFIFIIDADEYVKGQDWQVIKSMLDEPDFIVGMCQIMNTTKDGPVVGERVIQPRVFKNVPEIRYKYAIHNQIDDAYIAYAKKHKQETGNQAHIVALPFEITHTGYDLTPEEIKIKYSSRVSICRSQVEKAIEDGSARDEAYYKYQLALFLTMLDGLEEALDIWSSIEYQNLNVFNMWYSHYVAARAFINACQAEELTKEDRMRYLEHSLRHCSGMFEALDAPKTGINELANEPATWMIAGVSMLEYGHLVEDQSVINDAISLMIDGFLRGLTPPAHTRCVVNTRLLYHDIKAQFEKGSLEYQLLDTTDLQKGIKAAREIQRSLMPFDESILELVDTEYA